MEVLYDRRREPFVRDGYVELLQIANPRTNGRNTFSDDVLLSNTGTKMLVKPISRRKVQGVLEKFSFPVINEEQPQVLRK